MGVVSNGHDAKSYCSAVKEGDVIEMELDMLETDIVRPHATLSYSVNGKSHGVAFDDVPKGGQYVLCVAIERQEKLQIFQC